MTLGIERRSIDVPEQALSRLQNYLGNTTHRTDRITASLEGSRSSGGASTLLRPFVVRARAVFFLDAAVLLAVPDDVGSEEGEPGAGVAL